MSSNFVTRFEGPAIRLNSWACVFDNVIDCKDLLTIEINHKIIDIVESYYSKNDFSETFEVAEFDDEGNPRIKVPSGMCRPFFAFCKVKSSINQRVCLLRTALSPTKLYVNSTLVGANSEPYGGVSTFWLNKGENLFLMEFYPPFIYPVISIRISKYQNEIEKNFTSLIDSNTYIEEYDVNCVSNGVDFRGGGCLEFYIHLNNHLEIPKSQEMECFFQCRNPKFNIYDLNKKRINIAKKHTFIKEYNKKFICIKIKRRTKTFKILFDKKYLIDTANLQFESIDSLSNLVFKYTYINNDGKKANKEVNFFVHDIETPMHLLEAKAEQLYVDCKITEYDKQCIGYYLQCIKESSLDLISKYFIAVRLDDAIKKAISTHCDELIYSTELHNVFYHSQIDDTYDCLLVKLPDNYDRNIAYPLIVFCPTVRYSYNSAFCGKSDLDYIAVDITLRGVTLGSYVGEAAFKEAICKIFDYYKIDKKRIYLIGASNGASAALNQAENNPHIFAGICTLSGMTDNTKIMNLSNVRIINISSKFENGYLYAYKNPSRMYNALNDYTGVLVKNATHTDLCRIISKEYYKEKLLETFLDFYPKSINYTTYSNRNRIAYWMEIHGIEYGKKAAKVVAQIKENCIVINLKNAIGLSVTIPPTINKENFSVILNSKEYFFTNEDVIHFVRHGKGYSVVKECKITPNRKGTGILDVFLKPLRIIVPDSAPMEIYNVAKAFSEPMGNGIDPKIYVKYPIIRTSQVTAEHKLYSQVVIDCNMSDPYTSYIRNLCNIYTDKKGYVYQNKRQNCKYCIMQIITNPNDHDKTILYVNCNDITLLSKNFFTRKVLISTYSNGINPYLNNEALIFSDGRYLSVYEFEHN